MKNQYFGDDRDLFKYDLMEHLIKKKVVKRLFLIPLLTPQDNKNEGEHRKFQGIGHKNEDLCKFLKRYAKERNRRHVSEIRKHFKSKSIPFEIHREDEIYDPCNGTKYFSEISSKWLKRTLIVLDPDNGLEPKKPSTKHVRYEEIKTLFKAMDGQSVLMIFQYRPRGKTWRKCFQEKRRKLSNEIPDMPSVLSIRKEPVAFFFLVRNRGLQNDLEKALETYKECYRLKGITS